MRCPNVNLTPQTAGIRASAAGKCCCPHLFNVYITGLFLHAFHLFGEDNYLQVMQKWERDLGGVPRSGLQTGQDVREKSLQAVARAVGHGTWSD